MSYAFPTNLTVDDIQQCLADIQISFDPNQLTKPTYETIRLYYEQAVIALMGVTREELMQPNFAAFSGIEYPELHDESIPTINFFRNLTKLMVLSGVRDFNLNDLYKPETVRLKRNLCAVINFAKFRDEKVAMLDDLEASVATRVAEEQALLAEHEKNLAELQRLKALRAAREMEAASIQAETAAIAAKNMQLNKVHMMLSEEVRGIKAQTNALTDQAAEAKLELNSLHNEAMELQDQIVQSPDKHQKAISNLCSAAESHRVYYAALRSTHNDHERKLEMMAKFERELQRCIKLLEDLEAVVARKKDVGATTKDTREAIAKEERRYNDLVSINTTARRQLMSLQDKLSRMEQQSQLKLDAAVALVDEQVKRREAAEAEHAAGGARAAEQEAQIRIWRERAEEVLAATGARTKAMVDRFNALRRTVTEYNRQLEAAISKDLKLMGGMEGGAEAEPAGVMDAMQSRDTGVERGVGMLSTAMQRVTLG